MLSDALSWRKKVQLEAGYVAVLETAGRSGHWNPHRHILMTSGGMTPQKRWREVDYFPFTVLLCFRRARVNLDFPWPTVILMKETQ
jgi:Putative transposase